MEPFGPQFIGKCSRLALIIKRLSYYRYLVVTCFLPFACILKGRISCRSHRDSTARITDALVLPCTRERRFLFWKRQFPLEGTSVSSCGNERFPLWERQFPCVGTGVSVGRLWNFQGRCRLSGSKGMNEHSTCGQFEMVDKGWKVLYRFNMLK